MKVSVPDALFTRAIVLRGAFLWLGIRLLIAVTGALSGPLLLPTGPGVSILVTGATVFLAGIELRRRNEFLLLGSLGHAPALLLAFSALPVLPLELAFTALLR